MAALPSGVSYWSPRKLKEFVEGYVTSLTGMLSLQFDLTAEPTVAEGQIAWNPTDECLNVGGDNHTLQVGQESYMHIINKSGVDIDEGDAVMFTGALGNSGKVTGAKAVSDGTVEGFAVIGIATEDIVDNGNGMITTQGKVRGIQTNGVNYSESWVDGDLIYMDQTTAGALTKVQPTGAALKQPIAAVVNSHGSNGQLMVRTPANPGIHELHDVGETAPAALDILRRDAGDTLWESVPISDLGEYVVGSLPAAATHANSYALATDASGGRTIVRSDGTNWKVVAVEGATVTT